MRKSSRDTQVSRLQRATCHSADEEKEGISRAASLDLWVGTLELAVATCGAPLVAERPSLAFSLLDDSSGDISVGLGADTGALEFVSSILFTTACEVFGAVVCAVLVEFETDAEVIGIVGLVECDVAIAAVDDFDVDGAVVGAVVLVGSDDMVDDIGVAVGGGLADSASVCGLTCTGAGSLLRSS